MNLRPLAEVLQDGDAGTAEALTRHAAEVVEVDNEIVKLGQAIDNLREQQEALVEFRHRLIARGDAMQAARRARGHDALYAHLEVQARAVTERALATFTDRLPSEPLDPATLRERVVLPPFDGPALEVDLVTSVDAPDAVPELLIVLLPVRAGVLDRETARDALDTWLAARVAQAIFATARATDFTTIDVRAGPALGRDLLDLEVDLGPDVPAAFLDEVGAQMEAVVAGAPELVAAGLTVRHTLVPADVVFPAEETDDG